MAERDERGDAFGPALHGLYEQARAAWPEVALPEATFVAHVRAHLAAAAAGEGFERALLDLHGPDLYLACACAQGDTGAIALFEKRYLVEVVARLGRRYAAPGFADELTQVIRERLLVAGKGTRPRIAAYAGRGPLLAWVRVAATREAVDLWKKLKGAGALEVRADGLVSTSDPELDFLRREYGVVIRAAIAGAIQSLEPRAATMLRQFFIEGVKVRTLAAFYRLNERTVRRAVTTARQQIVEEARRLLAQRLDTSEAEFDSVIRLVWTEIDPSLIKLLGKPPGE